MRRLVLFLVGCCPSASHEAPPPAPVTIETAAPSEPSAAPEPLPPAPPETPAADGSPCDAATDCASGICEGEGCGAREGRCAPRERMCTRDLRAYCGCDGKTFQSSGTCPGRRFSARSPCPGDKLGF